MRLLVLIASIFIAFPALAQFNLQGGSLQSGGTNTNIAELSVILVTLDDFGADQDRRYSGFNSPIGQNAVMPAMDRLTSLGSRVREVRVNPACSTTRASILQLTHNAVTGVYGGPAGGLDPTMESAIGTLIRDSVTADAYMVAVGKFLGGDYVAQEMGFDYRGGHNNVTPTPGYVGWELRETTMEGFLASDPATVTPGMVEYIDDWGTDKLLELYNARDKDRRFFGWLGLHLVHSPFHNTVDGSTPCADVSNSSRQCRIEMATKMDTYIDQIWNAIDKTNTILIIVSDNGSEDSFVNEIGGKGQVAEHGIRVPFYVYSPKLPGATSIDIPIQAADIGATIVDLMGRAEPYAGTNPAPADVIGYSFSEQLGYDCGWIGQCWDDATEHFWFATATDEDMHMAVSDHPDALGYKFLHRDSDDLQQLYYVADYPGFGVETGELCNGVGGCENLAAGPARTAYEYLCQIIEDEKEIAETVCLAPPPADVVINSFTAVPNSHPAGGGNTLFTWDVSNATACTGVNFDPTMPDSGTEFSGNVTLAVPVTTTFTLNCTGTGNPASSQQVVTVSPPAGACEDGVNCACDLIGLTTNGATAGAETVLYCEDGESGRSPTRPTTHWRDPTSPLAPGVAGGSFRGFGGIANLRGFGSPADSVWNAAYAGGATPRAELCTGPGEPWNGCTGAGTGTVPTHGTACNPGGSGICWQAVWVTGDLWDCPISNIVGVIPPQEDNYCTLAHLQAGDISEVTNGFASAPNVAPPGDDGYFLGYRTPMGNFATTNANVAIDRATASVNGGITFPSTQLHIGETLVIAYTDNIDESLICNSPWKHDEWYNFNTASYGEFWHRGCQSPATLDPPIQPPYMGDPQSFPFGTFQFATNGALALANATDVVGIASVIGAPSEAPNGIGVAYGPIVGTGAGEYRRDTHWPLGSYACQQSEFFFDGVNSFIKISITTPTSEGTRTVIHITGIDQAGLRNQGYDGMIFNNYVNQQDGPPDSVPAKGTLETVLRIFGNRVIVAGEPPTCDEVFYTLP